MTAPRRWLLAIVAVTATAGCANNSGGGSPQAAPPASVPPSSSTPAAQPSATATSAFCLDLPTFQVGVTAYTAEVGAAIEGEPLDFEELRRKAALIADMGEAMRASAPPDVAEQLRTVLKAIDTSASRLKPGAEARDVVDPVYGEQNHSAFDSVNDYDCGTTT